MTPPTDKPAPDARVAEIRDGVLKGTTPVDPAILAKFLSEMFNRAIPDILMGRGEAKMHDLEIWWRTEREMHNAWRKRAEEAEASLTTTSARLEEVEAADRLKQDTLVLFAAQLKDETAISARLTSDLTKALEALEAKPNRFIVAKHEGGSWEVLDMQPVRCRRSHWLTNADAQAEADRLNATTQTETASGVRK